METLVCSAGQIALKCHTCNFYIIFSTGVIFHLAKEYVSAKHYYERALEIDSSSVDTRQNLEKLRTKLK